MKLHRPAFKTIKFAKQLGRYYKPKATRGDMVQSSAYESNKEKPKRIKISPKWNKKQEDNFIKYLDKEKEVVNKNVARVGEIEQEVQDAYLTMHRECCHVQDMNPQLSFYINNEQ
eukprot:TRINITY_DN113122_c0_g1_i1.p4 TRINITY_DN113122_c0_g1~~TRINITY_DN113122_c0_g1_i1.p4  ORF type:complete len:115 (-),score=15.55 TRINITY_DN113122_c0_g1_i1:61-405(-)